MILAAKKTILANWATANNDAKFLNDLIARTEKHYRKLFDEGKDVTSLKQKHEDKLIETLAEKALGEMGEEMSDGFEQKLTTHIVTFLVYSNYEFQFS